MGSLNKTLSWSKAIRMRQQNYCPSLISRTTIDYTLLGLINYTSSTLQVSP